LSQVLAAFGLTALITFGAIVIGYLTDSVPREYLNSVDVVVLDNLQKSRVFKWLGKTINYAWHILTAIVRRCLFMKSQNEGKRKPSSRARREKLLEKFVLTLSDQQLVTGTAILVATLRITAPFLCMNGMWSSASLGSQLSPTCLPSTFCKDTSARTWLSETGA
jgi:hypothetical protein